MAARALVTIASALLLAGCQQRPASPAAAAPRAAGVTSTAGDQALLFHAELAWERNEVTAVDTGCDRTLPAGATYLWRSHIRGTATSTYLGTGPDEADLCVFGTSADAKAPPGRNGTPTGWYAIREVWTAANGDRLLATGEMIGITTPPGTAGSTFIDTLTFIDGGTGRFEVAAGEGTGHIDPAAGPAVYGATIRFGRKK
jgi:hypothetical protein